MKTYVKKTNKKKPRYIILAIIILVILAASIVYVLLIRKSNSAVTPHPSIKTQVIDSTPATTDQVNATNAAKKTNADSSASESGQQSNSNAQPTTINIQSVNSYFQSSSNTILTSIIINDSISSGTCTLTISKGSVTKSYTADIQFSGTYSTCKGFTTSVSDLGSNYQGTWNVSISVTSGSMTGQASTTVNIT